MTKKEDGGKQGGSSDKHDSAMAARRARLRSSLAKPKLSPDSFNENVPDQEQNDLSNEEVDESTFVSKNFAPENSYDKNKAMDIQSALSRAIETMGGSPTGEPSNEHVREIALLNNIDQALGSCARHLASLQKVAGKQIDELKIIAETLQNHKSADMGEGLNTLMESLAAAIEPMKAIGELVPVLDRLVSVTEAKDQVLEKPSTTDEQLAISLAQQLAAGSIDPSTFKSAWKAVCQSDDVTVLVHRLGELLGEQQLSGELFQAAYQALQLEPLSVLPVQSTEVGVADNYSKEEISAADNADNKEASYEIRNTEREDDLTRQLADKEEELESVRGQLETQWSQLVAECEELRAALLGREELLKDKEVELQKKSTELTDREVELQKKATELADKDSENQQLRAQMKQLRDDTKAMMTDLQNQVMQQQMAQQQMVQKQEEGKNIAQTIKPIAPPSQSGFFDFVDSSNSADDLFTAMPKTSELISQESEIEDSQADTTNVPIIEPPNPANGNVWLDTADLKATGGFGVIKNAESSQSLATNKQANINQSASFVSAVGSYGSGVRAQVFEVIVRQALAGTQWREICAVPMQSNNISPDEVEAEVKRRQALLKK